VPSCGAPIFRIMHVRVDTLTAPDLAASRISVPAVMPVTIHPATSADYDPIWEILGPMIRSGETYPLPRTMTRDDALADWFSPEREVFVAAEKNQVVGTYYLRPNHKGGGSHVANCGYVIALSAQGRGVGRAMCEHSLMHAKARGFMAMQFNFVVSTNERAVRLWQTCGFEIVGRLPSAFSHPTRGYVDALVMFRSLDRV
jgi:ribosomal protein S18 acetylase RimI-like enzyme